VGGPRGLRQCGPERRYNRDGVLTVETKVDEVKLIAEEVLGHVLIALPVACHDVVALGLEALGEVRGDEATGSRDANLQFR